MNVIKNIAQSMMRKVFKDRKPDAILGQMVRKTAGRRHALYESNVGVVRKPLDLAHRGHEL
jgi:hypothetical protein